MSDLFSVHIKMLCGEDSDIPRYYDIVHPNTQPQNEETSEEVYARFASLRRTE